MERDLKRMRELCELATPGPWGTSDHSCHSLVLPLLKGRPIAALSGTDAPMEQVRKNAAFVAEARSALPALIDEVESARRLVMDLLAIVECPPGASGRDVLDVVDRANAFLAGRGGA